MNVYEITTQYLGKRPLLIAQRKEMEQQARERKQQAREEQQRRERAAYNRIKRIEYDEMVKQYELEDWAWRNNPDSVRTEVFERHEYYVKNEEAITRDYLEFVREYGDFKDENPTVWFRFDPVYEWRALAIAKSRPKGLPKEIPQRWVYESPQQFTERKMGSFYKRMAYASGISDAMRDALLNKKEQLETDVSDGKISSDYAQKVLDQFEEVLHDAAHPRQQQERR